MSDAVKELMALNAKAELQSEINQLIMSDIKVPSRRSYALLLVAVLALGIAHAIRHTVFSSVESSVVVHVVGSLAVLGVAAGGDFVPAARRIPRAVSASVVVVMAVAAVFGDVLVAKVKK